MPELPEGWFAAGGVLTGFVAKSLADLLQHRFVSERERAAREAAAKSQMQERCFSAADSSRLAGSIDGSRSY